MHGTIFALLGGAAVGRSKVKARQGPRHAYAFGSTPWLIVLQAGTATSERLPAAGKMRQVIPFNNDDVTRDQTAMVGDMS
jgi:hypothetical protein